MTDRFKTVYSKGNNFVINNNDDKIGINKASPEESLDVSGNIKFSGEIIGNINYNNLTNKPTIPSGNQVIDWTETSAVKINTNNYINTTYSVGDGGLTEKNFTTVLNTKLNGIAEGAQVNVKADWNATAGEAQEILNKPTIPTNNNQLTNGAGYVTQSNIDTAIANLVSTAPEHLDTLKELADAIEDTSNNKITALTTSIAEKLSTSDAQATYATVASVTTQLNGKQNTLTAGNNITIAQNGTISAQAGTTINSLNDIADVDVNTKGDGQVLKWNSNTGKWEAKDDNVGSGGGGGGASVTVGAENCGIKAGVVNSAVIAASNITGITDNTLYTNNIQVIDTDYKIYNTSNANVKSLSISGTSDTLNQISTVAPMVGGNGGLLMGIIGLDATAAGLVPERGRRRAGPRDQPPGAVFHRADRPGLGPPRSPRLAKAAYGGPVAALNRGRS